MPGWEPLEGLIRLEEIQLIEEGIEPTAAKAAAQMARAHLAAGKSEADIWSPFANLPRRADFPFTEPSDLPSIKAARSKGPRQLPYHPTADKLFDQMHGAWLGRCAGCALGKPVEGFMGPHNNLKSWERQKAYLTAISPTEWPLRDFIPEHSPAEETTGRSWCQLSTREHIAFMESDDDIRYTVLGQLILHHHGKSFGSSHVAHAWLSQLPYTQVCTAETQAYRNIVIAADRFRHGFSIEQAAESDASTNWHFITHHLNPYQEWIGAQIRIDSYGYSAPGNPELAAEFAFRDARISHIKNGIYGAMFCAAMIAAAFATSDPLEIIHAGLAEIPATSRLHAEMLQTIAICQKHHNNVANFEAVIADIYALLDHYHPVHTNNNAALCVMALLLSGGDFHKGITLAVMGGLDTDCNGATVGSIVGAITGATKVPTHWSARLNNTLNSQIIDYHPIAITECAKRSATIAQKIQRDLLRQ